MTRAGWLLVASIAAALLAQTATAAPRPAVEISASGVGNARKIAVVVSTPRVGKPVRRAVVTVSASMTAPGHMMSVPRARLVERSPGVYTGTVRFLMAGEWVVRVEVSGASISRTTARLTIRL